MPANASRWPCLEPTAGDSSAPFRWSIPFPALRGLVSISPLFWAHKYVHLYVQVKKHGKDFGTYWKVIFGAGDSCLLDVFILPSRLTDWSVREWWCQSVGSMRERCCFKNVTWFLQLKCWENIISVVLPQARDYVHLQVLLPYFPSLPFHPFHTPPPSAPAPRNAYYHPSDVYLMSLFLALTHMIYVDMCSQLDAGSRFTSPLTNVPRIFQMMFQHVFLTTRHPHPILFFSRVHVCFL